MAKTKQVKRRNPPLDPNIDYTEARRLALAKLARCHSHDALKGEVADAICAPFGIDAPVYGVKANTGNPKGLFVEGVKPGTMVYTAAVFDVSMKIADALKVTYATKMGRGFQHQECMAAIKSGYPEYFAESANA